MEVFFLRAALAVFGPARCADAAPDRARGLFRSVRLPSCLQRRAPAIVFAPVFCLWVLCIAA